MMNTARVYGAVAVAATPASGNVDASRAGSVKKQKQQRKANDSIAAKQTELSVLVGKLEDRDTQHQSFTALLELIPGLDSALVGDLYSRIEKNKNPGRSSTRRMFVLVLAAVCKYHPSATSRLLPRIMAYVALRLRDKETQVTDACVILCSAIALYVVPYATVNSKGCLSPRKKQSAKPQDDGDAQAEKRSKEDDPAFKTFENLVATLLKETNAVGEHATKCIAALVRPVEFDGTTSPSAEAMSVHGQQLLPYLRAFFASLVVKMNESTQYASFSPTFVVLQAILALAKGLKLDCENAEAYDMVLPLLGSLIDSIEDVFRDGPRDDWLLRKRAIEVLIQLIDLFVLASTATHEGRQFFNANSERVRRLVMEARHDPVSAVRDAALPAVFQFDALLKLFPRTGDTTALPSPFKRVYTARGSSNRAFAKSFGVDQGQNQQYQASKDRTSYADSKQEEKIDDTGGDAKERDQNFGEMNGDEAATPHGDPEEAEVEAKPVVVPALKLNISASAFENGGQTKVNDDAMARKPKETRSRQPIAVPRIASPKPRRPKRDVIPFQPLAEDEIAFPEEQGDEFSGHADVHGEETAAPATANDDKSPVPATPDAEKKQGDDSTDSRREENTVVRESDVEECDQEENPPVDMSRAEAAVVAAAEGEVDLALRLSFLEDDTSLLRKVLLMAGDPSMSSLSRATRTALCAAFLEFLEPVEDDTDDFGDRCDEDVWLAFAWLKDLSSSRRFVQQLDPRVARGIELRLVRLSEIPSKTGLVAADILTNMGL